MYCRHKSFYEIEKLANTGCYS